MQKTLLSEMQELVKQKQDIDKKLKTIADAILTEYKLAYADYVGKSVQVVGQKRWNKGIFERIDYRMSYDGQIGIVAQIRNGSQREQVVITTTNSKITPTSKIVLL